MNTERGTQNHRGCHRRHVRFVQVGPHAGDVSHVVTHVIGNHSRIARVVFGNPSLHLAHEVRAHISALGKDPPAHTKEEGHR